jgi:phage terminase large subunit-like protein
MIPKENFIGEPSTARGIANAYDTVQVRHKSGGISILQFKSYSQGVQRFASATLDFIWWDEEPPEDIYGEGIARITATRGMMFMTFTPLKGVTKVVGRFLYEPSEDRAHITMTIEDAKHIAPEERAKIIAGYPEHEREARVRGVPMLGEGRVFNTPRSTIEEASLPLSMVPLQWAKLWSIDFGISHPFAASLLAWDKDVDTVHVLHTIRMTGGTPLQHAVPMKAIAANVPVAWPHDGHQRDKGSGDELAALYRAQALPMLPGHATFLGGGYSMEAGILDMAHRFATGRLRVGAHLSDFFEEYDLYHRKNGLIVKIRDDILSATRGGLMMLRYARAVPLGSKTRKREMSRMADGLDFDLFHV